MNELISLTPMRRFLLCSLFVFYGVLSAQPLSGNYTIGGSAADYDSIHFAIDDLVANGVSGSVVFNIRPGTYEEQVIIPEVNGASPASTITFQSETGNAEDVTWQFSSPDWINFNWIVRLDASDHLRFSHLTFKSDLENVGLFSGKAVVFHNGLSENIRIEDNIFLGIANLSEGDGLITWHQASFPVSLKDIVISNNYFSGFSQAISLTAVTGTSINTGMEISHNTMESFPGNRGVYISSLVSPRIENNAVNIPQGSQGIRLDLCSGDAEVLNNSVIAEYYGIFLFDYWQTTPLSGTIANNMVIVNTSYTGGGMSVQVNADGLLIAHNTIVATGIQISGTALLFYPAAGQTNNLSLVNNMFIHTGPGKACIVPSPANSIANMDHNLLFTNGAVLATWGGLDYPTLSDLQGGSNMNTNSVSKMPDFEDPTSDLHLLACSIGDPELFGAPLGEVSMDFDGQFRNLLSPYIGADETFDSPPTLFAAHRAYDLGNAPYHLASGDLDGDDDRDILVSNQLLQNVTVFWNDGDGDFSESGYLALGSNPLIVAAANLDGDSHNDIMGTSDGNTLVRYGTGSGNFQTGLFLPYSTDVEHFALGDLDNDNDFDIVQAHLGTVGVDFGQTSVLLQEGSRDFVYHSFYPGNGNGVAYPGSIRLANLNDDSFIDALVLNYVDNAMGVFINQGVSSGEWLGFSPAAVYVNIGVGTGPLHNNFEAADFDSDNDIDVILGNWDSPENLSFLRNAGDGTFALAENINAGGYRYQQVFTSVDYDNDNDRDLIYAAVSGELILLQNNGTGEFDRIVVCDEGDGDGQFSGTAETIISNDFTDDASADIALISLDDSLYVYQNANWVPVGVNPASDETPEISNFELNQNYPNPFNPITTITFHLPVAQNVSMKIFDLLGREEVTIIDERRSAGTHKVHLNLSELSSGVYLYRLRAENGEMQTRKMILIK